MNRAPLLGAEKWNPRVIQLANHLLMRMSVAAEPTRSDCQLHMGQALQEFYRCRSPAAVMPQYKEADLFKSLKMARPKLFLVSRRIARREHAPPQHHPTFSVGRFTLGIRPLRVRRWNATTRKAQYQTLLFDRGGTLGRVDQTKIGELRPCAARKTDMVHI